MKEMKEGFAKGFLVLRPRWRVFWIDKKKQAAVDELEFALRCGQQIAYFAPNKDGALVITDGLVSEGGFIPEFAQNEYP